MQIQTMEASLSNELLEGEELFWSGRPDPQRRRIVSPARVFLILGLVYLPIGLVAMIIGLTLVLSSVFPPGFQAGSLGLFIPGGVFFVLGLVFLLIGLVGFFPSYGKRAITQVQRIERPDGSGDLIFVATSAYGSSGKNQSTAGTSSTGRVGAFSALPNVRLVEQKLIRMLNEQ